ncbi:MAG TPA: CPBP family intramembrane glutamic endopeptidase [Gemmataceae bacterium]|nr:CPBP family intramembrane glutamic endopeptidase [Gemmataceae bacterium]
MNRSIQPGTNRLRSFVTKSAALAEVCLVFALAHLSFRAFKQFTDLGEREVEAGLNYSTGCVLILFSLGAIWLSRRQWHDYGLAVGRWRRDLSIGLLAGLLLAVGAELLVRLAHVSPTAFQRPDPAEALLLGTGHVVVVLVILWASKHDWHGIRPGITGLAAIVLVGLLCLPVVLAATIGRQPLRTVAMVGWLFACAGFGEEIFFRGYVQSRVNRTFGRPWRILGVEWGIGLIVSSLLFGAIHVLNTVDYFAGRFEFAWGFGLMNCFAGFSFGLLREKTGTIVASGVTHGLLDVLAEISRLISGP